MISGSEDRILHLTNESAELEGVPGMLDGSIFSLSEIDSRARRKENFKFYTLTPPDTQLER